MRYSIARSTNSSPGLAGSGGEHSSTSQTNDTLYAEFVELCQMADTGGFSTVWTGEHHGMDFTVTPNPFLPLIDLAHKTKTVRLGTGTIVAPVWHPIPLAGEAAMADLIMGGRLELGLARGAYSFEYERVGSGLNAQSAGERLREMVPALRGLWAGDYTHDGHHWQFPQTTAMPKPPNGIGPPLWIAARDPASFEFAISQDCNIQVTPLWNGDAEVAALAQKFKAALASCRPAKRPQLMVLSHVFVADGENELAQGAEDLSSFFCNFSAWFQNKRPISQGRMQPLTAAEMAAMEMFGPEKMRKNLMIGTPGQVIDRLRHYEALGFNEFSLWLDSGMTLQAKKRSLDLFIREVMPAFTHEAEMV